MRSNKNTIIDKSSLIGQNTKLGYFTVIGKNVKVGENCIIGNNFVIHEAAIIGYNVRIDDNTLIGKRPMRSANNTVTKEQDLPAAKIVDNCIIGTSLVIYRWCTIGNNLLVADLATTRENVEVGDFTIVGRWVAIENFCKIGKKCKLETNVYLTAYSDIEDCCFLAPGVLTSNDNYMGRTQKRFKEYGGFKVKKGGRLGVGAVVLPGKIIEKDTVVAAGSLLTNNTEPKKIYAGMLAKYFRDVPEEKLLENNL